MSLFRKYRSVMDTISNVGNVLGIDTTVARNLVGAGASQGTATAMGATKQDNLTSGSSDAFFTSVAPERATAASIAQNRLPPDDLAPLEEVTSSGGKMYPADLGEYFMMFQFYEYQRPTPFSKPTLKSLDQISLPIPSKLEETHTSTWTEKEAGIMGDIADLVSHSMNEQQGGSEGAVGTAEGAGVRAGATATRSLITGSIGKRLAMSKLLPGDLDKHFGQAVGSIMNPHLTQFFDGPTFQEHAFSWSFHPRSPAESNLVKELCIAFKRLMLPSRAIQDVSSFLAYPAMVQVSLHPDAYLYPFKKCAVTTVNIDYAPNGYRTFKGTKAPREIKLSIALKGIEYFLSEDFGGKAKYANADEFTNDIGGKLDRAYEEGKNIGGEILGDAGKMIFGGGE